MTRMLILTLLLAGCAKSSKTKSPCETGVNANQCTLAVVEHSSWAQTVTLSQTDPKTNRPKPGSERDVTVTYEFAGPETAPRFRRSVRVNQDGARATMFEEGRLAKVEGDHLDLVVERSSCDENTPRTADEAATLYYGRIGASLKLDTQPIRPPSKNPFDFVGEIFANSLAEATRTVLESAFTFGSLRQHLTSGHGSFHAVATDAGARATEGFGCFDGLGSGFTPSRLLPSWPR